MLRLHLLQTVEITNQISVTSFLDCVVFGSVMTHTFFGTPWRTFCWKGPWRNKGARCGGVLLQATQGLVGFVRTRSRDPIPGANISIEGQPLRRLSTELGEFWVPLAQGSYQVVVTAPDYYPMTKVLWGGVAPFLAHARAL